jgi:hypothetical protein
MEDFFPLFSVFLVISVCAVCYCRNRHHRQQNRDLEYVPIPFTSPTTNGVTVPTPPKPSAPPMSIIQEEATDPIV